MESQEVYNLFRVKKTILQMLEDRYYKVSKSDLEMSFEEFKEKFPNILSTKSALNIIVSHKDNDMEKLWVFFHSAEKIAVRDIQDLARQLKNKRIDKAIVVSKGTLTSQAKEGIHEFEPGIQIQHFEEKELIVNITKHELVPKHVVLSEIDKKELLKRYKVKESQLPKILVVDPVARYYGLHKGQVVKIIRKSETAGLYVTYRLAI